MTRYKRPDRWLTALLVLALVAAACGSDGGDSQETASDSDDGITTATVDDADGESSSEITITNIDEEGMASLVGQKVTADPLGDRGPEPSGTLSFGWNTGFSPVWFDPSVNTTSVSQFATQYVLHDALVKGMPGRVLAPSLAESYMIAPDFLSAEFTLREGLTFHDGSPLTTEDVAFTYTNYKGTGAEILQGQLKEIEIVDDLTIRFHFNTPFLDFLVLYGSTATGAGWILPKDYYERVGPDGFLAAPIGAGPFKFVENQDNNVIVYEAFDDYWRKNPGVETLNWHAIADNATRFAALQTGELDLATVFPGDLLDAIRADPNLDLVPTTGAPFWLEFVGYEDPSNPFHDKRVREAVSLALDRATIQQAEAGGGGGIEGQWIPEDYSGALQVETPYEFNVDKARELMAEAGYPDGFDAGMITPLLSQLPLTERVVTMLAEIGITLEINQIDRGEFLAEIGAGKEGTLTGVIKNISGAGGDAFSRIRNFATCDGQASRICDPFIDERVAAYDASTDLAERQEISEEIQQYMIDELHFVYVYDLGLNHGQGPRVVEDPSTVWAQIPQYVYPGLWEDINVTD
ncbi:MAG: ABC transporter substrate-binding protein [Acidimicrobiales bacterium]